MDPVLDDDQLDANTETMTMQEVATIVGFQVIENFKLRQSVNKLTADIQKLRELIKRKGSEPTLVTVERKTDASAKDSP